uniref:Cadherin domain-containing protein n=1 Tax=Caenorhabditis tropicalis TaxID=1561998 RepID=A0A1I7TPR6_9PELO
MEQSNMKKSSNEPCEFPIYEAFLHKGTGQFSEPVKIKMRKPEKPALIGGSDNFELEQLDENFVQLKVLNTQKVAEQNLNNAQLLSTVKSGITARFQKPEYQLQVVENRESTILGEVEAISDVPLTYEILGEHSEMFQISKNGEIQNLVPIDREKFDKFKLIVKATDRNGSTAMSQLEIHVKDENDNPPVFEKQHYFVTVEEGKSEKVLITATDVDTGKNGQLAYSILQKTDNLPIDISPDGMLFIGAIDRESMGISNEVNLTIIASDSGEPKQSSKVMVTIRVKDVNDNEPVFSNSRYSIPLDANISPGGIIGYLQATDHDATSPNNYITFTSRNSMFKVSDSGDLLFVGPGVLDKNANLEFNVTASDGGEPMNSATAIVILNEHRASKVIENELTTQINSNDTGGDKQIKLQISMRKGKREVPVDLIINVMDTDEVTPFYSNSTVARELTAIETVSVGTVIGEIPVEGIPPYLRKDIKPIFKNSSSFAVSIQENSVLGTVLDLPYPLATDQDSDKFSSLKYSITGDEGFFKIDEGSSIIRLVAPLDYETQRIHSLSIKCVDNDGKDPHHEVFASITVHVIDINDNSPIIHNTDLTHLTVEEDAEIGQIITVLVISDSDESGLQKITVDVNSTSFHVDSDKRLLVQSSLKGYGGQRICSTVTATDAGGLVVTAPYCVTVYPAKDTHHNPLVVSPKQNSIHYFDENIAYEELLRVKVLDEEGEHENITFQLDEMFKKDWQLFTIGKTNGSLTARQQFDFEKKTVHEIKVLTCRVNNCTSTHLFISVNDRNDNCPMFPKQDVRLTVLENEKGRRQVGRIPAALDSDFHSDNTKVCYTTDTPIFFFSDPTLPILFTNSSFDREFKKQHQITITAYDCHLSCRDPHKPINGTIVALIHVVDVNDNFPKFSEKIYTTTIVQGHVSGGSHILTVQATDLDEEPNGLKYTIRGFIRSPTNSFTLVDSPISIDKSSGELTANEILKDSSYTFTVVVTDGAGHEDTASVMVDKLKISF